MLVKAIIVDIDGTLSNCEHRVKKYFDGITTHHEKRPFLNDFHKESILDPVNLWCLNIIKSMQLLDYKIILLTGRPIEFISETNDWLDKNKIKVDELFMRGKSDNRPDHIIKEEIFKNSIKSKYKVEFIIEDRLSVVKMWRRIGLVCLQCDWGDF